MENLIRRYTRLVKTCARPYFLAGADAEDLMQEGMLGLLNAVREYDESKGAPFGAFARLCITRKIYSAVKAAASLKHDPLNQSMSIDRPLFEDLAESRTRVTAPNGDPESLVIGNEEREERKKKLYSLLSEFEAQVLTVVFWTAYRMKRCPKRCTNRSNLWIMPSSASSENRQPLNLFRR